MRAATMLARTLWGECRGEPYLGQLAVACVIRNRVDDIRWPDTYEGVVLQPKQFSCWNGEGVQHDIKSLKWKVLMHIANGIIEDLIPDVSHGANHYINAYAQPPDPEWARQFGKITLWPGPEVGVHTFFRL